MSSAALDGEDKGTSMLLSFWLIGSLVVTSQIEKAEERFK